MGPIPGDAGIGTAPRQTADRWSHIGLFRLTWGAAELRSICATMSVIAPLMQANEPEVRLESSTGAPLGDERQSLRPSPSSPSPYGVA